MARRRPKNPVRVAYYERRNRDLDPQLVWRGKDQQDWSDLVVQAPPLYIQEKVHPKALIDDLLRQTRERRRETGETIPDPDDPRRFAASHGEPRRARRAARQGAVAVFVRSTVELPRARAAVEAAALPLMLFDEEVKTARDHVSVGIMPLSKGLEFRAVAVMACDDEVVPLQARIEDVTDDADLEEVYDTERHLLYVACTRARDHLLVTGVTPASEFLDDLRG